MNEQLDPGIHLHLDQLGQEDREYGRGQEFAALTYSIVRHSGGRASKRNLVELTIGVAGDYAAGGINLDEALCGIDKIDAVVMYGTSPILGVVGNWDKTNGKLKLFKTGAALSGLLAEVAGADVAGATLLLEVIGDHGQQV